MVFMLLTTQTTRKTFHILLLDFKTKGQSGCLLNPTKLLACAVGSAV